MFTREAYGRSPDLLPPVDHPLYWSIMPSTCPERRLLSKAVAAAVQAVYRAKRAYDSAKMKNTENVEEIGMF